MRTGSGLPRSGFCQDGAHARCPRPFRASNGALIECACPEPSCPCPKPKEDPKK